VIRLCGLIVFRVCLWVGGRFEGEDQSRAFQERVPKPELGNEKKKRRERVDEDGWI